jgi:hypothetical protein
LHLLALSVAANSIPNRETLKYFTLDQHHNPLDVEHFLSWTKKYKKAYSGHSELHYRFFVFLESKRIVAEHNSKAGKTFTMALNKFSDLTNEEFVRGIKSLSQEEIERVRKRSLSRAKVMRSK